MTSEVFWMHRNYALTHDITGYSMFGTGHLLWLLGIIVFSYVTGRCYSALSEHGRDNMRKTAAVLIILLEYAKIIAMGLFHVDNIEFLPLHLCSAGGLATLVYALWPGKLKLDQLFGYAFFPAALLAGNLPHPFHEASDRCAVRVDVEHILAFRQMSICKGQELLCERAEIDAGCETDTIEG